MDRKLAKLIRGFAKMTNTSYRQLKRSYWEHNAKDRKMAKENLIKFWKESSELDHRKYYDLKKPLVVSSSKTV